MGKLGDLFRKGVGAPIKLLLPKNPWLRLLVFAIPILLIAAFLEPVLGLLARGFDLVLRIFEPLLDNPVGRVVLLNILLFGVLVVTWYMVRDKLRALRSGMVLRHHLTGVGALVVDPPRSRQLFRKVATTAHRAQPPAEYPLVGEDAKIKLARLALDEGDHDNALAWLTRVREKGLPKELQRSLLQLRIQAAIGQGEVLDASVEREIREGLRRFGDDGALLAQLCQLLRHRGGRERLRRDRPAPGEDRQETLHHDAGTPSRTDSSRRGAYPDRLRERLASLDPSRRYEVINAALPGYGLTEILTQIEREFEALDVDVAIVAEPWNFTKSRLIRDGHPPERSSVQQAMGRMPLAKFVTRAVQNVHAARSGSALAEMDLDAELRAYMTTLAEIHRRAEDAGMQLVLGLHPDGWPGEADFLDPSPELEVDLGNWRVRVLYPARRLELKRRITDELRRYAEAQRLPTIDWDAQFRSAPRDAATDELFEVDRVHLTVEGADRLSGLAARRLVEILGTAEGVH